MKSGLILGAAAMTALSASAPLARAVLIAYDGFDTASSNGSAITGATDTDTTGWAGQWYVAGGSSATLTTGLTYSQSSPVSANYATSGQAVVLPALSGDRNFRSLATASQIASTIGNTVWVSFLINNSSTTAKTVLELLNGTTYITEIGSSGVAGTDDYGVDNGTAGNYAFDNSTVPLSAGATTLLVAELSYSTASASTISLWVDPDITASNPGTAAVTDNLSSALIVNQIGLYASGSTGSSNGTFDEIRLGTAYTDVVPEPAVLGLLAPTAVMFAGRRSRRRPPVQQVECAEGAP